MSRRMQDLNSRLPQLNGVAAVVQRGAIQRVSPEFRLVLQQMNLRVVLRQHRIQRVDVIVVTVRQQDIGNAQAAFARGVQNGIRFPGRIDHGDPLAGGVGNQVDEILHRPQFQRGY